MSGRSMARLWKMAKSVSPVGASCAMNPVCARSWVGSDCIRRYLILHGAETREDSWRMFTLQTTKADLMRRILRPAVHAIESGTFKWEDVYFLSSGTCRYFGVSTVRELADVNPSEWRGFLRDLTRSTEAHRAEIRDAIMNPRGFARRAVNADAIRFRNPSRKEIEALMRPARHRARVVVSGSSEATEKEMSRNRSVIRGSRHESGL